MSLREILRRLARPLASRKVRVALTTFIAAFAAEHGLGLSEEMVLAVISIGVALILGIAHEDAGKGRPTQPLEGRWR